jgi:hypothetical protein
MNKKLTAIMLACGFVLAAGSTTEASWLSKILDSASSSTSSGSSTRADGPTNRAERWSKVYTTDFYTIYIDTSSIEKGGEAQGRYVNAWFKRVYTPEGSAWLGNHSRGAVKPDVITHSVYKASYSTRNSVFYGAWKYYDVKNHLIYDGHLADCSDEVGFGEYVPDSPNEQIKDILFRSVGWDY